MTGSLTARAALLVLVAVIALGAGLLWWLLNHSEVAKTSLNKTSTSQPMPPTQAERNAPAEKQAAKPITSATETIKDLATQLGASKPAAPERGPQFDVARIEPNGDSVIAGRATPNATVELLRDEEVHDQTVADATGAFVLIPKPLPPGKYALKLRATEPGGKPIVSSQSVAVELGSPAQDKAVAAITPSPPAPAAAPQKPASSSDAPATAQPKPAPAPQVETHVRIDLAEAQDGGKLYVSGRSAPGANVRLYLNDAFIAAGTASADGQVSFFIGGGVKPGEYRIRLDQIGASDKVTARAEVPFTAPATLSSTPPASTAASAPVAPAAPSSPAPQTTVAATQPPQPASPPQTAAPASPSVTADVKPQPQSQPDRLTTPPATNETKPASAPQVATAPEARIASSGPAPTSPQQTPVQPRSATPTAPQAEPAPQAGTVPRDVISAAPNPTPTTQAPSPAPAPPATAAANDTEAKSEPAPPQKAVDATARSNTVVVPNIDTRVVIRGDNLWRISRTTYGHGLRYTVIYRANRDQIRDPDLIYPGQIFVLPKARP